MSLLVVRFVGYDWDLQENFPVAAAIGLRPALSLMGDIDLIGSSPLDAVSSRAHRSSFKFQIKKV